MAEMTLNQVCIVLTPEMEMYAHLPPYSHYIYIMDLTPREKANVIVPKNANIRLSSKDFPLMIGFSVLGTMLYIFGGHSSRESRTYNLSAHAGKSEPVEPVDLKLSDCKLISPFKHKKSFYHTAAIGTKICLFHNAVIKKGGNFELYDPETDEWLDVPDPELGLEKNLDDEIMEQMTCYFVDGSRLFISMDRHGWFVIDLGKLAEDWIWERIVELPEMHASHVHPLWEFEDSLISPFITISAGETTRRFGERTIPFSRFSMGIELLPKEPLKACIVDGGFDPRGTIEDQRKYGLPYKPVVFVSLACVDHDDDGNLLPARISDVGAFYPEDSPACSFFLVAFTMSGPRLE